MGDLFSITLVSGIILLCLYLPYKLLLARERQHRFNRIVVLSIYLTSVMVPLLQRIPMPVGESVGGNVAIELGDITAGTIVGEIIEPTTPMWSRILLWVYIVGVVVTLLKFLWSYIRLLHIIRTGRKEERNGYTLVIVDDVRISPFSWQKYVVMGESGDADESNAVMVHELRHIAAHHSADILIAQLYAIFVWYNPVSWLMIDELRTVHEYEADDAVIESGANLKEYQMLLIKKTVGARLPSLANSLNHSKLQKRITMMYQSKSRLAGKIGSLVLLPALAIGIAVVSSPAVASVITDASEATLVETTHKVSKKIDNPQTAVMPSAPARDATTNETTAATETKEENNNQTIAVIKIDDPSSVSQETSENPDESPVLVVSGPVKVVYSAVEKIAEFPGGMPAMMRWLSETIRYPEDAFKNKVQGRVIVKFIVNADGSISDPTVIRGISPSIDNEAIRVIKAMPKWEAAENHGEKVASYFTIPMTFQLTDP